MTSDYERIEQAIRYLDAHAASQPTLADVLILLLLRDGDLGTVPRVLPLPGGPEIVQPRFSYTRMAPEGAKGSGASAPRSNPATGPRGYQIVVGKSA